jgi:hypothetical protein
MTAPAFFIGYFTPVSKPAPAFYTGCFTMVSQPDLKPASNTLLYAG